MSAIYGIVNLDGKEVKKDILVKMECEYKEFKIDKFDIILHENAAFGTGLQFITKQSENEVLPYFDEVNHNLFTADCYLDNRQELIPLLKNEGQTIDVIVDNNTPDAMLIYLSYLKWGQKLCDHLLGVFAIAIYNYDEKKFHLFLDHCGDRCVHYYLDGNTLYFSTIIRPLQAACDHNINISEKYIAACESNYTADMVVYPGMTPFDNVFQLLASEHLSATYINGHSRYYIEKYWDPISTVQTIILENDDDYKKLFLETYSKCVTDALNVDGKVGCFLSSGLDSTSVASHAALYLKEKGETLHSYTSVPIKEFLQGNPRRLEDESVPVQKFCDHFGNITPTYISCNGKSALTEMKRLVHLFNSPIKYSVNGVWLDEIYKRAASDGCKVILKGQHGNCSVSYGGLIPRMWYEFKQMHFKEVISQYKQFSSNMYLNKKGFINAVFTDLIEAIHPTVNLDAAITRKDLLKKYKIKQEYVRRAKYYGGDNIHSEVQRKRAAFMPAAFQQVSFSNAHFELMNNIIARDPTRDKRMIELCLALPPKCFSDGQYQRRLITYYMKDIMPAHIIRQMYKRGLQSADFVGRLKNYPVDKTNFIEMLSDDKLRNYIDDDILKKLCFNIEEKQNLICSLNALSLYYFLNQN